MLTFEELLEKKRAERRKEITNSILNGTCVRPKGMPKKEWKAKQKEIAESGEIQARVDEILLQDKVYLSLAEDNEAFKEKYAKYKAEEDQKAYDKLINERMERFKEYVLSKLELLNDLAKEKAEEVDDYIRDVLSTSELQVEAYDYSRYYDKHYYKPLDEDNYNDLFEDFDNYIEEMADEYVNEVNFTECILSHLEENDHEQFQLQQQAFYEGIPEQYIKSLYDIFADVLYVDEFLYDELQTFYWNCFHSDNRVSEEETCKLVRNNPHYKEMFERMEREKIEAAERKRIIESGILERIPNNPVDLYPLARVMRRKFVLHIGSTNSGKTHDALEALMAAETGVYLAPLRLLAFECSEKLNAAGVPCSLITGEEERIVEGAKHTASTVELLNISQIYDVAVLDEAQMISGSQRGAAWTAVMLGVCAHEVHVCAAPYAEKILEKLIIMCGDTYEVKYCERKVPLQMCEDKFKFPDSVKKNDALIVFSKRDVLAVAAELQSKGTKCSIIYGNLPYEARQNEVKRFIAGETDVVVATDAIGMGMNLPIERIVFLNLKKYDGKDMRLLRPAEAQQIAGRAGRQGIYDVGWYTSEYSRGDLQKMMDKMVPDCAYAVLGFAPNLVGVHGKLSDIIRQWSSMPESGAFRKADMQVQLELCEELEYYTDNKELIYRFMTIPFDVKNEDLKSTWETAFLAELSGEHIDFGLSAYDEKDLDSLEHAYKYCDLMYFYRRRFCNGIQCQEIMEVKAILTEEINLLLASQKLQGRKCRDCGRPLAWNYTYNICQRCYNERRAYRYSYYGDDDWY